MKVSYKWLAELVDLDGLKIEEIADRLTNTGLEVEKIQSLAYANNLVIGEVIECVKHPDSDHLQLTKVNIGKEILQIVCGAKNCCQGIKVIVAKIGAKLKDIEIKKAKVRGIESNGMLCSLSELGVDVKFLNQKQLEGIEILNNEAVVGNENVLEYLNLDDYILDVKPTPNRPDLLSVYGIARELSAIFNRKLNLPDVFDYLKIENKDLIIEKDVDNCQTFLATRVFNLKIKDSPEFIKHRLKLSGITSINNVIDISNYVMLELGQPLHFYDLDKINDTKIIIKDGYQKEFIALDGNKYLIEKDDIVILDNDKIIAIAGVMGGDISKIDDNTKNILIEAGIFKASKIRNTARKFNLLTESANRFSKGIENNNPFKATIRAIELLKKYADAEIIENTVTSSNHQQEKRFLKLRLSYINGLLGTSYSDSEVFEVLKSLNFNPIYKDDIFEINIPSYRQDIKIEQDIVEEVVRILGIEKLDKPSINHLKTVGRLSEKQQLIRKTKEILNASGLDEVVTYTLIDERIKEDSLMVDNEFYKLLSPMSEKRTYVRESLMGSILECVSYNKARKVDRVNIFEISSFSNKINNYQRLGIYLDFEYNASKLKKFKIDGDFYTLKGIIISYLNRIGINNSRIKIVSNDIDHRHFYPYKSAKILLDNKIIGLFGNLHPNILKKYDLVESVYAEIKLDEVINAKKEKVKFKPLERYPSSFRDISLIVDKEVEVKEIIKIIKSSSKLVKELEIFDIYQGEHIGEDKKSVAVNVIYSSVDHTLSEEELNEAHNLILDNLLSKLKAEIRR